MSSSAFSAEFIADRRLRCAVLLSGATLAALGLLVIMLLPVHFALRVTGAAAWAVSSGIELVGLRRAYSRYVGLRVGHDGAMHVQKRGGDWQAARLLPGSLLLRRTAWIRVQSEGGEVFAELLRGECRRSANWRRLHVIWRHIGATPGSC